MMKYSLNSLHTFGRNANNLDNFHNALFFLSYSTIFSLLRSTFNMFMLLTDRYAKNGCIKRYLYPCKISSKKFYILLKQSPSNWF